MQDTARGTSGTDREERRPRTLVQKLFDSHRVHDEGGRSLIYIDRLVIADTALPMFDAVRAQGHAVRRPGQAILIPDHFTLTLGGVDGRDSDQRRLGIIHETEEVARQSGIKVFGLGDPRRGIQHIVAAEQAFAQPGITVATADSHTSTQGALGALAFSIGSDLAHVLATQCTWVKLPGMMRINLEGSLQYGVTAKDVALAINAKIGARGAAGLAVEYAGNFIRNLAVEARMTICNMSAEMGARLGIVAPDEKVIEYLRDRPFAPDNEHWSKAVAYWRSLSSDPDAVFEKELTLDVSTVAPMVTWGNNASDGVPITGVVPDPANEADPDRQAQMQASLDYMGLRPSMQMTDIHVDQVFIGSCTNARIDDLRAAAKILRGHWVVVPTLVVPGSGLVKAQAETEGLADVFKSAGATWGEAGCSMCAAMNGDLVPPGARCASTSNRNHVGRQGRGSRTHLMSPAMAAAAAIKGRLIDVRKLEGGPDGKA